MRNVRFYVVWAVILILGLCLITAFILNANSKTAEKSEQEALQVNRHFIERFFNYNSTNQRYEGLKTLMTDQGYGALFPSGIDMPKDTAIKSRATDVKAYVQKDPVLESQMEILNEFLVTTEFGGIGSSQEVIMRTSLLLDGSSWKINDVEMIIQNMNQ